jgi:spore coat polysaccharide biosynthesis predicted glycosyltransferase SpsG
MKALIRADASVEIGMGHRVRCQALIHAFEALGWHCQFVVDHRYKVFASSEDCFITSESEFWQLAKQADLVILDHYAYQANDINYLYQHQKNLLVLDDMNDRGNFSAAWVLNPLNETYTSSVECPLVGSKYALLRPAFSRALTEQSTSPQVSPNKLLITLGGTDPLGLTLPIVTSLLSSGFPAQEMIVLLGANATKADQVMSFCDEKNITIERGLSDVTPLMKQAKMAISAAGGTLFELACLGVPTLFAQVADNQTRSLEQHVPLDWCRTIRFDNAINEIREERIKQLIDCLHSQWEDHGWQRRARQISQNLVDDKGAIRVAREIHSYFSDKSIKDF